MEVTGEAPQARSPFRTSADWNGLAADRLRQRLVKFLLKLWWQLAGAPGRFASAPGVRAGSLPNVAQTTYVSHHAHGSNAVVGSRASVNLRE